MNMQPLSEDLWDQRLASIATDMDGRPLKVHGLMANHPKLLEAWWNFRNHSVSGGALGPRYGELVILRVAFRTGAWYEWASHVVRGQAAGLSLAEIDRVKAGSEAEGWSEAEAALLAAVDELLARQRLQAATRKRIGQHFDERQVMDLMAITGMYFVLACMINTFGLELDEDILEQLPEGVSEASFRNSLPPE